MHIFDVKSSISHNSDIPKIVTFPKKVTPFLKIIKSAANVDNIRLEHETCEATMRELVRNKGHDLDHYIDDTEKAIVQLWKDMASEIKAREQRDYDINLAIKDAELEATKYYLKEAIHANVTVQNYARDMFNSLEVEIAQNITMTEYQETDKNIFKSLLILMKSCHIK